MGNTTRRKPVSFNIPNAPDYKFLNIINFAGLEITDNIFNASTNNASDILNVYVDESNSLTTRPRLEQLYDAKQTITKDWLDLIGVYPIKDGFLIHGHDKDNIVTMVKLIPSVSATYITGTLPNNECRVIEQGGKLYLLDGENYYLITNNSSDYVYDTAYIPTLSVGNVLNTTEGTEYEPINILSDYYKESYRWDGISNTIPQNGVVENNSYREIRREYISYYKYYSNGVFLGKNRDNYLVCGKLNTNTKELENKIVSDIQITADDLIAVAHLTPTIVIYKKSTNTVYLYEYDKDEFNLNLISQYTDNKSYVNKLRLGISTKGKNIWLVTDELNALEHIHFTLYLLKPRNTEPLMTPYLYSEYNENYDDFKTIIINDDINESSSSTYPTTYLIYQTLTDDNYITHIKIAASGTFTEYDTYTSLNSALEININFNSTSFWITYNNFPNSKVITYFDYDKNKRKEIVYTNLTFAYNTFNLTEDSTIGYFLDDYVGTQIVPDFINNPTVYYETHMTKPSTIISSPNNIVYFEPNGILIYSYKGYELRFYSYENTIYDNIIITRNIETHEKYKKIIELRNKFLKSNLTIRFDNNNWFGSDNYIFRTNNNDPSYIDYSWWTTIGDDKDNITGFNVVQNTVLVAYKRHKLWTIQLAEITDNFIDYIITESKNTVGNDAFNAPIITTLTELPLQITYDGIYALTQITNVQSTDRISTLISENINKKWLNEDDKLIDNAITLNRLYWTYIILRENTYTKIYLLDNRVNAWYYWELPITCITATIKENTVVFVDNDGKFYKLITTDIINPYNKDLTEYYDNDHQIIKWKWKSQILPLGTINYSKKLIETTFILTDSDEKTDGYGLNYKFYSYKQIPNETNTVTISDKLLYVQSVTKRTLVPRCNFIQIELSNIEDDFDNNKLRLIGLGLKYVLLERLV